MKILSSGGEAETTTGRRLERTTLRNDEPILGGNNICYRFTVHVYTGLLSTIIEVSNAPAFFFFSFSYRDKKKQIKCDYHN